MKFKVILHEAEEGGYWATVPALPGCVSEGDTREEMLANIREDIECHLDVLEPPFESNPVSRKLRSARHLEKGDVLNPRSKPLGCVWDAER